MKKKIMITLGGGGHLWQSMSLLRSLPDKYEYVFITTNDSMIPKNLPQQPKNIYRTSRIVSISDNSRIKKIKQLWQSYRGCRKAILQEQPDVVIGIGTAVSVPLLFAAKLSSCRRVYIESITRVDDLSLTGKLVLRLGLCNKFFVQWPELQLKYPKTQYKGTVL